MAAGAFFERGGYLTTPLVRDFGSSQLLRVKIARGGPTDRERENLATRDSPNRHEAVTHVSGTIRNLCLRVGHTEQLAGVEGLNYQDRRKA
jgi:hypothetical protein